MVNYSAASLDRTFAALSDPTRRAILARLAAGEATISDLASPFEVSLPAISKHIRVLEHAGLLTRRKRGREHHCRLSPFALKEASEWLAFYRRFWTQRLDDLASYLAEGDDDAAEKRKAK
jgi:DNA-binding transcriptional ArsR family regulator